MPSRRVVLVGLSGLTAAVVADLALGGPGSGHDSSHPTRPRTPARPPDPAEAAAAADERALIAAYEQAARAHPALAATLALPLAHHRVHLAALTGGSMPATATSATTVSAPPPAAVPVRRSVLTALQAQEQAAAARRTSAAPADLAGGALLAQIGAAEAVHVDYLEAAIIALAPQAPPAAEGPTPAGSAPTPR